MEWHAADGSVITQDEWNAQAAGAPPRRAEVGDGDRGGEVGDERAEAEVVDRRRRPPTGVGTTLKPDPPTSSRAHLRRLPAQGVAVARWSAARSTPTARAVSRSAAGRGAWVCSLALLRLAVRRRAFERAWRRVVGPEALATLRIAVEPVITNMEELSAVGSRPDAPMLTKG